MIGSNRNLLLRGAVSFREGKPQLTSCRSWRMPRIFFDAAVLLWFRQVSVLKVWKVPQQISLSCNLINTSIYKLGWLINWMIPNLYIRNGGKSPNIHDKNWLALGQFRLDDDDSKPLTWRNDMKWLFHHFHPFKKTAWLLGFRAVESRGGNRRRGAVWMSKSEIQTLSISNLELEWIKESMVGNLVPLRGGLGGIVHPPIGRKNTTYIPLIVLAFWGVLYATDPTFYRNLKNPLKEMGVLA